MEFGIIVGVPAVFGLTLALIGSGKAIANMLLSIESVLKVSSESGRYSCPDT